MGPSTAELVVAGRYRVLGEIGRGGMGAVMLVEHVHTGDRLALKVLHKMFGDSPDIVERFRREARAAAKIKSEHVVRVIDADVSPELGGIPFMVMELLEGEDARRRLRTLSVFGKEQTLGILWQVARALDRAHAVGIVHRDIKPENIFLHKREDGVEIVKLLDFGVAKMRDDLHIDAQSTQAGTLLGTPYFMAPEQVRNTPVSAQTDVWAIGMLAYRFLAGASYWPSATTGELMAMILHEALTPPSARAPRASLGPAFDAWFMRSCDRDPARRWASVGEQVAALADAFGMPLPASISLSGPHSMPASQSHSGVIAAQPAIMMTPAPTPAPTPPPIAPQAPSRSMLGFWLGLFAVLAIGAVGFVALRFWQAKQQQPVVVQPVQQEVPVATTSATTPAASAAPAATAAATPTATAAPSAVTTIDLTTPPTPPTATAAAPTTTATASPTGTAKKKVDTKEDPWAR